jgi:hypothetical protein
VVDALLGMNFRHASSRKEHWTPRRAEGHPEKASKE